LQLHKQNKRRSKGANHIVIKKIIIKTVTNLIKKYGNLAQQGRYYKNIKIKITAIIKK